MAKALRWIKSHKVEDIVNLMPQEYYQGSKEIYARAVTGRRSMWAIRTTCGSSKRRRRVLSKTQ